MSLNLSPASLSLFLAQKKIPSLQVSERILKKLMLSPQERSAFVESVLRSQQSRALTKPRREHRVDAHVEFAHAQAVQEEHYQVISEWYHFAILELTFLPNAPSAESFSEWASRQLGISAIESRVAVDRLESLGYLMLSKSGSGSQYRKTQILVSTQTLPGAAERTSEAHKRRQAQILQLSKISLFEDDLSVRDHSSMTMAIDPAKIPEAKKKIQEFRRELCRFLEGGAQTQVFELNISLFGLTHENREEVSSHENN